MTFLENFIVPKCSVILSIYNMSDILDIILDAFNRQTFKNFEIILSDDGSSDNSKEIAENFKLRDDLSIKFITQEKNGFQKCKILNKSIQNSNSEYLIFSDGDCIPHRKFVEEHYKNRKQNTVLCGRRVNLSEEISEKIKKSKNPYKYINSFKILFSNSKFKYEGIYLSYFAKFFNLFHNKPSILGSNFSLFKEDILKINGFDERYTAPGVGEDNDVQYRLSLVNIKFKWIRNRSIQYHLYHIKQKVPDKNLEIYKKNLIKKEYFTPYGINKISEMVNSNEEN